MVLCLLALPVFAVLGIFSLKYRKLAKDALECLFKTVTLRKCRSGLDDRIKDAMAGTALKLSPKAAGMIYKNYKIISWVILALFIWSAYASAAGVYNYAKYGNCNGPVSTGFCLFDPRGANSKISELDVDAQSEFLLPLMENNDPLTGDGGAELTIIEFGCYSCPYTKKAEPVVKEVLEYYKGRVNLQFKSSYIPTHKLGFKTALAADCALEQNAYPKYHELLFEQQANITEESFSEIASKLNLNISQFNECLETEKYKNEVNNDALMGMQAGVVGTPTFFINDKVIVGPKPFRTFKTIIDEELEK